MKKLISYTGICFWMLLITAPFAYAEDCEEPILKVIEDAELNVAFMDLSAAPSSIVGGAVNVITGSYVENECDLVIPGANPLILQRSYNSSNLQKGTLCDGWNINFPSKVLIAGNVDTVLTCNDRGFNIDYEYCSGDDRDMKIPTRRLKYGVTNCSGGYQSSQTNIKKRRLQHYDGSRHCELHSETGEVLFYSKYDTPGFNINFRATRNELPNGCVLTYHYDKEDRLHRVVSKGSKQNNRISYLTWKYPKEFKSNPMLKIESSDGRSVTYKYRKKAVDYILSSVVRDDGPEVSYEQGNGYKTRKKNYPENRYLKIEYYASGINKVGSEDIKISSSRDSRKGRVLGLYAPVGTDASPILIWSFKYDLDHIRNR